MDKVYVNITEVVDNIDITVVENIDNVDITVVENVDRVEITATETKDIVEINVTENVDRVQVNVVEGTSGGGGAVDSVNGQTGTVVLDTSDINETTDKNYITDAQQIVLDNTSGTNTGDQDLSGKEDVGVAQDIMDTHEANHPAPTVRDSRNEIVKGSDDNYVTDAEKVVIGNTSNTNTGDKADGAIDHNALLNYEANQHFTQSGISIPSSQVSDFDTEVSNNTDVNNNTTDRHTHSNKTVLDNTTASYTTTEETKLSNTEISSQLDTRDTNNRNRANHTGTQLMSTISDKGALATLDTVGTSEIDTAAVTSNELADTIEIPNLTLNVVETNLSTLSAGVAIAANFLNNSFLQVTLTDNCTITVSNLKEGINTLKIIQPAAFKTTGSKAAWGTPYDNSPEVAEVNNATSTVQFVYDGTNTEYTVLTVGA